MTEKKRKMPVRTRRIELDGDWEGWWFVAKVNPPIQVVADLLSGNIDRMLEGANKVLIEWNFVDEEGKALPPPQEYGVSQLPTDLFQALASAAGNAPFEVEKN